MEKNNQEIENKLLSELNSFNTKINISKMLIALILTIIPSVLVINIVGLISDLTVGLLFISLIIGLIFSLRMFNYNKILYKTHVWILDCIINEKPLV